MTSLANQYYLKALDSFHYDNAECLENLQYAVGCDAEHVAAHVLLGRLYYYQLKILYMYIFVYKNNDKKFFMSKLPITPLPIIHAKN